MNGLFKRVEVRAAASNLGCAPTPREAPSLGLPKLSQVPYRGSAPAIQDVVGNQLPCMMDAASLLIPFISSGRLRPILVTGNARLAALPNLPTAAELGIKDFVVTVIVGLWGPPKMPADTVAKANAAMNMALADPAISSQIIKNGDMVGAAASSGWPP